MHMLLYAHKMTLDRRVHILLDEPRYRRVENAARARGTSVANVIREAIDKALPADLERKRLAWEVFSDRGEDARAGGPPRNPGQSAGVIVVDATVLVYAIGVEHPLKNCERIFEAVSAGRVAATTTVGVLQEFADADARLRGRADAVDVASRFAELLAPLVPAREEHVAPVLELFAAHPELDAFDAFLAAAALDVGAGALVSANRAFAVIAGLRYVDPADAGVDSLLGT